MNIEDARDGRSARVTQNSSTDIAEDAVLKPLRDNIILEPVNVALSKIIIVKEETKPLRGIVKAVGPGCYPKKYDNDDKSKRTKMWDSEVFQPTVVQVGDVIELGGYDFRGYTFPSFYWGSKLHLVIREEDISGVLDMTADEVRAEADCVTV